MSRNVCVCLRCLSPTLVTLMSRTLQPAKRGDPMLARTNLEGASRPQPTTEAMDKCAHESLEAYANPHGRFRSCALCRRRWKMVPAQVRGGPEVWIEHGFKPIPGAGSSPVSSRRSAPAPAQSAPSVPRCPVCSGPTRLLTEATQGSPTGVNLYVCQAFPRCEGQVPLQVPGTPQASAGSTQATASRQRPASQATTRDDDVSMTSPTRRLDAQLEMQNAIQQMQDNHRRQMETLQTELQRQLKADRDSHAQQMQAMQQVHQQQLQQQAAANDLSGLQAHLASQFSDMQRSLQSQLDADRMARTAQPVPGRYALEAGAPMAPSRVSATTEESWSIPTSQRSVVQQFVNDRSAERQRGRGGGRPSAGRRPFRGHSGLDYALTFVPDGGEAWSCCEVRLNEEDRQLIAASLSKLVEAVEVEHSVLESAHRAKLPRRPNTSVYVDVFEMFAGTMPFTRRAAFHELMALEPQDLWNGWDYHRAWDKARTIELVEIHHPRIVIAGVECTPGCWFNVQVNYKHRPEELAAMQKRSLVFMVVCEELFELQLRHGDEMFVENPAHSSLFRHRICKRILAMRVVFRGRVRRVVYRTACMCRFGKTNSEGVPIQKKLGSLITDGLIDAFDYNLCKCICGPNVHAQVKRKETRMSMAYPDDFVDHVLDHVSDRKAMRECMVFTADIDHGVCEPHAVCMGFKDISHEESDWMPVVEAIQARLVQSNVMSSSSMLMSRFTTGLHVWCHGSSTRFRQPRTRRPIVGMPAVRALIVRRCCCVTTRRWPLRRFP